MENLDNNLKLLNSIVNKLEKEDVSLDESVELFNQGMDVAKNCFTKLNETKGKITILKQEIEQMKEEIFN